MNEIRRFHVVDYIIFSITVAVSVGIGIFYACSGGRQKTTSEYLVGGRKMSYFPVAISLLVSCESSIMMLGVPAEAYVYGIQWWICTWGYLCSHVIAIYLFVPLIHPLKITSTFEYLELRYKSWHVRLLGTLLGFLSMLWYMGIVLYGPSIALEAVTGFPQWVSVWSISVAAVIYTSIGGIKAVIWTDVFQSIVMFSGVAAILIKGTMVSGGVKQVWNKALDGGRLNLFNFDPDPTIRQTFWSLFFGTFMKGIGFPFEQPACQRISSIRSRRGANNVMFIMAPLYFLTLSLAACEGIVAYAYYTTIGCDPLESKQISNPNQIIPYIVMDIFQSLPGMTGLFIASLFSASLSTLSTGLSSASAIILQDFVKKIFPKGISEAKSTAVAKVSVLISGALACGIALLVSKIGGTLIQVSGTVLSSFFGPLAGLFLLSSCCPWANKKGALISTIMGLVMCTWLGMGASFSKSLKKTPWLPPASTEFCEVDNTTSSWTSSLYFNYTTTTIPTTISQHDPEGLDKLYSLSYMWFTAVGVLTVLVFGSIISLLTGAEEVESKYIVPAYFTAISVFPESTQKRLKFRVVFDTQQDDAGIDNNRKQGRDLELEKIRQDGTNSILIMENSKGEKQ